MRASVPCFLLISGFYLIKDGTINISRIDKQLWKIAKIIVIYNSLFLVYVIGGHVIEGEPLLKKEWLCYSFWIRWLFIGDNICYPYWYLTAYCEALIIMRLISYRPYILRFAPILMLFAVALNRYSFLFTSQQLDVSWSRNGLLCAFPCIVIGTYIAKNKYKIAKISLQKITVLSIMVCSVAYMEYFFLNYYDIGQYGGDYYFMTFPLSITIMLLALKFEQYKLENGFKNTFNIIYSAMACLGKYHATNIYLFHVMILSMLGVIEKHGFDTYYFQTAELVFLLTLILSIIINSIKKYFAD